MKTTPNPNRRALFAIPSLLLLFAMAGGCRQQIKAPEVPSPESPADSTHVVFVTGDEEYRSEESMPMLARLVRRELGAKVTVCYALDSAGYIDPNRNDHIEGLEALEKADLMVLFTRFRALPEEERRYITDFADSGKPMVGFRTATHAFLYEEDPALEYYNNQWPASVFGQQWIVHHGHFDDGRYPLTKVTRLEDSPHPILRGFEPFEAYSWLYHVEGGDWSLQGEPELLLRGESLKSRHQMEGKLDQYPLTNPVAWTKTYTGQSGKAARVFFTTLGHPYDFKIDTFRCLALNGIAWALGREGEIPEGGFNPRLDQPYEPNNSGFGEKYKKGRKPPQL